MCKSLGWNSRLKSVISETNPSDCSLLSPCRLVILHRASTSTLHSIAALKLNGFYLTFAISRWVVVRKCLHLSSGPGGFVIAQRNIEFFLPICRVMCRKIQFDSLIYNVFDDEHCCPGFLCSRGHYNLGSSILKVSIQLPLVEIVALEDSFSACVWLKYCIVDVFSSTEQCGLTYTRKAVCYCS